MITWSSVTARLCNSHSAYLHTPGVTTRKPLPAVIQIPGLCRVLGHTSRLPTTHGTGVVQHHQYQELRPRLQPDYNYYYRHLPPCKGYLS